MLNVLMASSCLEINWTYYNEPSTMLYVCSFVLYLCVVVRAVKSNMENMISLRIFVHLKKENGPYQISSQATSKQDRVLS